MARFIPLPAAKEGSQKLSTSGLVIVFWETTNCSISCKPFAIGLSLMIVVAEACGCFFSGGIHGIDRRKLAKYFHYPGRRK